MFESSEGTSFQTPDKKRKWKRTVPDLDKFDEAVVWRTVYNFYVTEKCFPTVESLRIKLQETIDFQDGESSHDTATKNIGFHMEEDEIKDKIWWKKIIFKKRESAVFEQ
jgi:hypothetical protein